MANNRSPHRRVPRSIHRWVVARPHHRPTHHLTSFAIAIVAIVLIALIGLAFVLHPLVFLDLGLATNFHRSDLPPLLGISLLAVPAILLGLAGYRAWWALRLDFEAWKQHRRRRKAIAAHR
jgi:hypothetical protein